MAESGGITGPVPACGVSTSSGLTHDGTLVGHTHLSPISVDRRSSFETVGAEKAATVTAKTIAMWILDFIWFLLKF